MSDDDLCWWPAWQVAEAIAARHLSAREYLQTLLTRRERLEPGLGLIVSIDERAWERAAAADAATVRGVSWGPLHGVAMTVKDSLRTAGLRTTAGSPRLAPFVPKEDATTVAALRRAGAVIFGKTNLAENCGDVQSTNPVFGPARNPWDPSFSTGGSSGGSAGAVAAGMSPLDLGSDIAGSIRIPAAHCGAIGHKPSYGLVPLAGHVPPYQPVVPDLVVVGPLGRDVRDVRSTL
ncbi:amidase [Streptomyces sp. NPDC085479]|uniref:amidase n=1 Tax=Streptomyces sp. NPDC085479 TaxID=3365726 RepID=UPI0037D831B4